jgi:hypothetical protein
MQRTRLLCTDQSTSTDNLSKSVRVASREKTVVTKKAVGRSDTHLCALEMARERRGSLFQFRILAARFRPLHEYKPYRELSSVGQQRASCRRHQPPS